VIEHFASVAVVVRRSGCRGGEAAGQGRRRGGVGTTAGLTYPVESRTMAPSASNGDHLNAREEIIR